MKPTVGRIVHYVPNLGYSDEPRAAIITGVHGGTDAVSLTVFGQPFEEDEKVSFVTFAPMPTIGSWSWPPRE